jgi:2-polyprenyl-3-methyl-5-hydroxy-6-metoxy-1,4-benzoquinol methylase
MLSNDSDKNWEVYGKKDPYYGVLTHQDYKSENLNKEALLNFFKSGEEHIDSLFLLIRKHFNGDFCPQKCLDFGCGAGRLVIPLAKKFNFVLGVDVSKSMLDEAQKNCKEYGLSNVELIESDDKLSKVKGTFDFIHSFIVLQHIPRLRGEKILVRLIDLLNPGGIAALHFTYYTPTAFIKAKTWLRTSVPFVNGLANLLKGKKFSVPVMLMTQYDLNYIVKTLEENNCDNCYMKFTKHSGFLGVIIFFQK